MTKTVKRRAVPITATESHKVHHGRDLPIPAGWFSDRLLEWYKTHGRDFLWRRASNPYVILVAEVFLKQTPACRVEKFLPRFLEKYGSTHTLAVADFNELLAVLQPLGLQEQRARHLKLLGVALASRFKGRVPSAGSDLESLPGIGDYARDAIGCFAFNERVPIVDTNVVRVLVRVFNVQSSKGEQRRNPELRALAARLLPSDSQAVQAYNWALLDLASLICKPRRPLCQACPIFPQCCSALRIRFPECLSASQLELNRR